LTVFCEFLFEFGVWVKIPRFFYGTRRPYRVLYKLCFCLFVVLLLTFLYLNLKPCLEIILQALKANSKYSGMGWGLTFDIYFA
jgi:hypothetical protein